MSTRNSSKSDLSQRVLDICEIKLVQILVVINEYQTRQENSALKCMGVIFKNEESCEESDGIDKVDYCNPPYLFHHSPAGFVFTILLIRSPEVSCSEDFRRIP